MTRDDVIKGVTEYVRWKFAGDWPGAFASHDGNGDDRLTRAEVAEVLEAAGLGNRITRPLAARAVIDELDSDGDDAVSLAEFLAVFDAPRSRHNETF